jgi:hypothetical protein
MIAKIGCYICAMLHHHAEVPVLPFILGVRDDGCQWVGSVDFATQAELEGANFVLAHTAYRSDTEPHIVTLVARVKLFANTGATGYEVVVHRGPAPMSD